MDKYAWSPTDRERGNRIIARLCGISKRETGKRMCLSPWLECEQYPLEHEGKA